VIVKPVASLPGASLPGASLPGVVTRGSHRMPGRWLAVSLALGVSACAAGAPPAGSTAPAEQAIAAIHTSKCGACHTPPGPKTRTRDHLEEALSRHKKRVHLTSDEWEAMTDYLALPEGKTARQP
jgi:hypothetical protein